MLPSRIVACHRTGTLCTIILSWCCLADSYAYIFHPSTTNFPCCIPAGCDIQLFSVLRESHSLGESSESLCYHITISVRIIFMTYATN